MACLIRGSGGGGLGLAGGASYGLTRCTLHSPAPTRPTFFRDPFPERQGKEDRSAGPDGERTDGSDFQLTVLLPAQDAELLK
jgi:hypothetical protein